MKDKELNDSYNNKETNIQINNILDFSFGEENNDSKTEDIDMIDNEYKNIILEEKNENKENNDCFKNPKNEFNIIKNNIYFDNKKIIKSPEISKILISKKRRRKNECLPDNNNISELNNIEQNPIKKIKNYNKLKKLINNPFYHILINLDNNEIHNNTYNTYNTYEKNINIKEDSLENDNEYSNKNDTKNIINNISCFKYKDSNFNNDINEFDYFLNKFNKINLDKKGYI